MGQSDTDLHNKVRWVWRETLKIYRQVPGIRLASSLSAVDIFVALYYGGILSCYPGNPLDSRRDRCIISKGHGSICLYPILADRGYFSMDMLQSVGQTGSILGSIPDPHIPGFETINGSLGHGLGIGAGLALGLKRQSKKQSVFVVVGDGELHEGANWEAIMFASHHCLDNLHLIVDDNQISMLGRTDDILTHNSLSRRLTAFGWECVNVDGHDVHALQSALARQKERAEGKPKAMIARTIKGNRVPGLADVPLSHILSPKLEHIDALLEESL